MLSSRVFILRHLLKQECIPVGCVPSAAVAVFLGVSAQGSVFCLRGVCPGGCLPRSVSAQWGVCLGGCALTYYYFLLLHMIKVRSCGKHQRFTETVDRSGRFVTVFVHHETVTMWRHWRRHHQRLDQNSELCTN